MVKSAVYLRSSQERVEREVKSAKSAQERTKELLKADLPEPVFR